MINFLSERLNPVKLYFDDLERIVEILHDVSSDINVSTDEYELGGITDLLSLDQQAIHELEISTKDPRVVLQLGASGARVYASDSTPICIGVVEKIKKQLKPRSRKLGWLVGSGLTFTLTFTFAVGASCVGLAWSISSVQSMNVRGVIGGIMITILIGRDLRMVWETLHKDIQYDLFKTEKGDAWLLRTKEGRHCSSHNLRFAWGDPLELWVP